MSKQKRFLKDEAQRAASRGEWGKALQHLQAYCAEDPEDLRARQKLAEALERLGRKDEAIREYRRLAETFSEQGFLVHAISINKIILRIDPSLKDVNDRLAQLYTEKFPENKSVSFPPVPLFSELNTRELQSLVSRVSARTFEKGERICQEGDPSDSFMVIGRGEVGIFKRVSDNEERWIRNLKEGDFFGEFGFFTDQKRHATVKAASECEILEISRNAVQEAIEGHPGIRDVLSVVFEKRVLDLFVAASPLFSRLSGSEREKVCKRFRVLEVPRDTLVFQGGDPPGSLYFIKKGAVEIFLQKQDGGKIALATLESGDFFGEIGHLFKRPRMASAKTSQPSELLELSPIDLDDCIAKIPQIRLNLVGISKERLSETHSELLSHKRTQKIRGNMI